MDAPSRAVKIFQGILIYVYVFFYAFVCFPLYSVIEEKRQDRCGTCTARPALREEEAYSPDGLNAKAKNR